MSEEHRKKYFPPKPRRYIAYPFYKTKDGDDCLRKILTLSCYSGGIGSGFAVVGALKATIHESPQLGSHLLIRLGKYALPMAAAGAMFSAAICTMANVRGGANDPYNHFVGGLAVGSVFGAATRSHAKGWGMGIFIGLAALIWKAGKLEGWANIDGEEINRTKGFYVYKRAWFTERPDPEGNRGL